MIDAVVRALSSLPREWVVFILGALPISEVRGAIPFGLISGIGIKKTLIFSVAGNISFIVPMLFLFEPVSSYLRKIGLFKRFFGWLLEKTKKNADIIERYEALGLMIFVAVPFPLTGAWSGCIAATLFKIRFRYALLAITAGVIIAALVVMAVCLAGKGTLCRLFFVK